MTSAAPPRLDNPPRGICLGIDVATRQPFCLPEGAFLRGVHVRGAIGAGKTSLIRQILMSRGIDAPFINFDYIGTGHRELQAWVATTATMYAIAEDACPDLAGITAAFLRRFAFLTVGGPQPPVRFDLLLRRTLPGGRVESLRAVVSRAVEVLFVKLNDVDAAQRVRFLRVATALLTVLAAARRSIADGLTFLDVPDFMRFLDREIESSTFRSSDIPFLQHQRMELDHILRLRPSDPGKSWRAFEDETSSTRNSLADFAIGTVLGDLLNDETLPLEDVAFGRTSLSITNREPEELQKTKAYQAVHAMLHALFLHRQDVPGLAWPLVVTDEPQWMGRNLERILAVSRNLGVSYVVAHQSDAQWEGIGLPALARQLPALTNLQITFRPTTFDEAETDVLHTTMLEPDGLVQRFWTASSGENEVSGSTVQRSWANALHYSEYADFAGSAETRGNGESSMSNSGTNSGEHETLNVVGFSDQVKYRAQAALRRPSFRGVVTDEGEGAEVAFLPAPSFPPVFAGVDILDLFRKAHNAVWRARATPRTPYDPQIRVASALAAPSPPNAPPSAGTPEPAHPTDPPAPPRLPPRPPVPPRFPSAGPPQRRKRAPRKKPRA